MYHIGRANGNARLVRTMIHHNTSIDDMAHGYVIMITFDISSISEWNQIDEYRLRMVWLMTYICVTVLLS